MPESLTAQELRRMREEYERIRVDHHIGIREFGMMSDRESPRYRRLWLTLPPAEKAVVPMEITGEKT